MNHSHVCDVADRLGRRLARHAIWDGPHCTWEIRAFDRSESGHSVPRRAAGPFYQGTSGIGWYLAELSRATAVAEFARVA